jgi:type VI secretion system secreted protein VgrG
MAIDSFRFAIEGHDEPWHVAALEGTEALHAAFHFTVTLGYADPPSASLDVEGVIGKKATLTIVLADDSERAVHGVVRGIEAHYEHYRVTIEPRLGLLADTVDHQAFLAEDAAKIALAVLAEHQVPARSDVLRALPPRAQCVQAFETDLDFVRRILAEEGVFLRVDHDGGEDLAVLVDSPLRCPDVAGPTELPFVEDARMAGGEHVTALSLRREIVSVQVEIRDYDFERPALALSGESKAGKRSLERYEFPGGFKEPKVGSDLAKIRLEEAQQKELVLRGESNSRRLAAGRILTISSAPLAKMNGRWLLTEVRHRAEETGEQRYRATFTAIPADRAYRPARLPAARLGGVQTATVTGPAGAEIHTDEHGRMHMLFRHERRRSADEKSSAPMRSIQPPTSGGVMLPRTGWEVLVGFSGASGDAPFEIGRLYNGADKPPEGLPGKKVVSAIGTATTPGGGGGNVLRTNDAAGSESMDLTASRDMSEVVANDRAQFVTGLEKIDIGGKHTFTVKERHGMHVKGAWKTTIASHHEVFAGTNHEYKSALELTAVGGARLFKIGGDYKATAAKMLRIVQGAKAVLPIEQQTRKVTGHSVQLVGAAWSQQIGMVAGVSVLGASVENIGAAKVIRAKKYELSTRKLTETYASREVTAPIIEDLFEADTTFSVKGAATFSAPEVKLVGHCKITIEGSGAKIVITPSKVTMDGKWNGTAPCIDVGDEEQS